MPGLVFRIKEGLVAIRARPEPDEASFTQRWLTDEQQSAFRQLADHDRGHLVRVARTLASKAPDNNDLIIAGLLHDLGKTDAGGVHRVRLVDRAAKVILERVSPALVQCLARPKPSRLRAGFVLAVHHPAIGAERAARLGCSDRSVWLIKHHEDSKIDDPELRLLADVDDATP